MNDTIYRRAALEAVRKCSVKEVTPAFMLVDKAEVMTELMMLPSAQPEPGIDEMTELIWCTDCKEYNKEKGCCPRFNHVIRTALKEADMKKNDDIIHIHVYATDLKKSAIKRIMRELGYPGCDPGRFGLDNPRTIVGITSFSLEESKAEEN